MIGWGQKHFQVSGLGRQVPGTGFQVQVQVRVFCPLSSVIDSALYSVLHLLAFPAPTPIPTPLPSLHANVLSFLSSQSRRPHAAEPHPDGSFDPLPR